MSLPSALPFSLGIGYGNLPFVGSKCQHSRGHPDGTGHLAQDGWKKLVRSQGDRFVAYFVGLLVQVTFGPHENFGVGLIPGN